MKVTKEQVDQYIPQQHPIRLVHGLKECKENSAETIFEIPDKHLFVKNKYLLPSGIIENMAQSVALVSAYRQTLEKSDAMDFAPRVGYIAGLDNVSINELPYFGNTLETVIEDKNEVFGVKIVQAMAYVGENLIGSTELKIIHEEGMEQ